MKRRTIRKDTLKTLADEYELYLDGSGENCMNATTVLDERGLQVTGSLEAIIEVVAFIAMEVGAHGDNDEADDLVNGLVNPHLVGPNSGSDYEMSFPHFHVA